MNKKFCLNKFTTLIDNQEYNIYQQLNFLGLYATFVVNEKYQKFICIFILMDEKKLLKFIFDAP